MPGKIKSAKQFRFMEVAAHGGLKGMAGPSPEVAKEILGKESEKVKSNFAKEKFSRSMRKRKG